MTWADICYANNKADSTRAIVEKYEPSDTYSKHEMKANEPSESPEHDWQKAS